MTARQLGLLEGRRQVVRKVAARQEEVLVAAERERQRHALRDGTTTHSSSTPTPTSSPKALSP